ncbi:MAG: hypothetical protein NVSMB18_29110 [Acetobacteraceae bacterium]
MGLLDSVLGGLLGGNSNAGPLQSVMGSILGGGGGQSGMGGLGGLVNRFQQAGLGDIANSWVGNGPNQPVAPQQLQQVFGHEQINQWSQQSGMEPQGLLSQLSHLLPHAVDQMTPNGQMPSSPFDDAGVELPRR